MKIFEGKTKDEKTKIIIALVLGTLALLALINLFFSPFSGSRKSVTVNLSPTPTASAAPRRGGGDTVVPPLPRQNEIDGVYMSTAVAVQYPPGAPDAGRNIFAFYEPPIPTPYSPTPVRTPTPAPIVTPTPPPPPNVDLRFVNKQSVYAGEKGFRLEVGGDKFTPETQIWFGGVPLPTNFVSAQQLWADVPTNYIAAGGQKTIEVRTADGRLFSNQLIFNVQQPPLPQFQYLGIVSRKRGNNDTAYVMEQGKTLPTSYRLNDIIGGRFRVISISPAKMLVQDISLGFLPPYPIELVKGSGSTTAPANPTRPGFNDPSVYQPQPNPQQCPPGIPCTNLRPYNPQMPQPQPNPQKDVDDNDDDPDNR